VLGAVALGLFVERELAQIEREQDWKWRALTDSLTALPNRRAFERGMLGLRSPHSEAALVVIDLDHFKVVNDTFGHAAGDRVLQQVSKALRASLRDRDMLSRLGGEELAVLLPDTNANVARQVAERLRACIDDLAIDWQGETIGISASFGVALALGTVPTAALFAQADAALYAAKHAGRNRVVFSGDMVAVPAEAPLSLTEVAAPQEESTAPPRAA
ncbi:MAG: GGDEF domain-containing protein, partial [Alphaproteobacteria bacterium]|nr:GGDEF domain-containing protein [Alphaproteobacteria bacterium]